MKLEHVIIILVSIVVFIKIVQLNKRTIPMVVLSLVDSLFWVNSHPLDNNPIKINKIDSVTRNEILLNNSIPPSWYFVKTNVKISRTKLTITRETKMWCKTFSVYFLNALNHHRLSINHNIRNKPLSGITSELNSWLIGWSMIGLQCRLSSYWYWLNDRSWFIIVPFVLGNRTNTNEIVISEVTLLFSVR